MPGTLAIAVTDDLWREVSAKIVRAGDGECWEWTGNRDHKGYGRHSLGAHNYRLAHRIVFTKTHGPIPNGLLVRHRCDNPPCCNPAHLLVGTIADNMQDRTERNRTAAGERHPAAKLTWDQVREIRRLAKCGMRQVDIAARFRMGHSAISGILNGANWREHPFAEVGEHERTP